MGISQNFPVDADADRPRAKPEVRVILNELPRHLPWTRYVPSLTKIK